MSYENPKQRLVDKGLELEKLERLESLAEDAARDLFDQYDDYDPEEPEEAIEVLKQATLEHILWAEEMVDTPVEESWDELLTEFEPENGSTERARSNLKVILGEHGHENRDLLYLSNEIMRKNYEQSSGISHS